MACKSTVLCFFFFFFFILFFSVSSQEIDEEDCKDRLIYIRRLPSRFNLDLLTNCSAYPLFDNFCPYLQNHGLGPKTHNRSHSWYRSDSLLLELIFHRRILEYPCLTQDLTKANAVYLPYYAALDSLKYLYGAEYNFSNQHGLELYDYLQDDSPQIWNRYGGQDHFLVMARPAWDFSQPLKNYYDDVDAGGGGRLWGTSFLEVPEFFNVTALVLEGRAWPWQEQAIPYPTSYHPANSVLFESWVRRVRNSRRINLMLFAGGGGVAATPNIRRSIRDECENNSTDINGGGYYNYSKVCEIVDCSNGLCEHDPIRYMKSMLQSTFCLQPPGDTPTRRSTFDGILAGCIPVFFEELSAKAQYKWHLPEDLYDEFSVFIQKEDVVFKGLKIFDVLMSIPKVKVRRMREKLIELMPRIMYRRHGSSLGLRAKKDAFDIAIEGTLEKIRSRINGLSVQ